MHIGLILWPLQDKQGSKNVQIKTTDRGLTSSPQVDSVNKGAPAVEGGALVQICQTLVSYPLQPAMLPVMNL